MFVDLGKSGRVGALSLLTCCCSAAEGEVVCYNRSCVLDNDYILDFKLLMTIYNNNNNNMKARSHHTELKTETIDMFLDLFQLKPFFYPFIH